MRASFFLLIVCFTIVLISLVLIVANQSSDSPYDSSVSGSGDVEARLEVLDSFKPFNEGDAQIDNAAGRIVKDKVTSRCYLMLDSPAYKGSMAPTDCP